MPYYELDTPVALTIPAATATWHTIDVSAYVPKACKGVFLYCASSLHQYSLRPNGTSWAVNDCMVVTQAGGFDLGLGVDSDFLFQIYHNNAAVSVKLVGFFWGEGSWAYPSSLSLLTATTSWADLDLSSIIPSGAKFGQVLIHNENGSVNYSAGARPNGSTVDPYTQAAASRRGGYQLLSLDSGRVIEVKAADTTVKFIPTGWILEGTPYSTPESYDYGPAGAGAYEDQTISQLPTGGGSLILWAQTDTSTNIVGARKNGSSFDNYGYGDYCWRTFCLSSDTSKVIEVKAYDTSDLVYLMGLLPAIPPTPSAISAAVAKAGTKDTITLTWPQITANSGQDGLDTVKIYRIKQGETSTTLDDLAPAKNATSGDVDALTENSQYAFGIASANEYGESAMSLMTAAAWTNKKLAGIARSDAKWGAVRPIWVGRELSRRANVVPDGDLSAATLQKPYAGAANGSLAIVYGGKFGAYALQHTASSDNSYTTPYTGSGNQLATAAPNDLWTASVWVKANQDNTPVAIYIYALDSSYNELTSANAVDSDVDTADGWVRLSVSLRMPASTAYVSMRVDNDTSGKVVLWDGFQCEKMSPDALEFSSAGTDRVNVGDEFDFNGTPAFSVEAWVYPKTAIPTDNDREIVCKYDSANKGWRLYQEDDTGYICFAREDSGGVDVVKTAAALTVDTWAHIAATYDGTNLRIYKDGSLIGSPVASSRSLPNTSANLRFGQSNAGGGKFNGLIKDVRIWSDERSATEISDNDDLDLNGTEAGLAAYWPLRDGTGSSALNRVSGGTAGTLTGCTWVVDPAVTTALTDWHENGDDWLSLDPKLDFFLSGVDGVFTKYLNLRGGYAALIHVADETDESGDMIQHIS